MARYAYAPLSIGDRRHPHDQHDGGGGGGRGGHNDEDQLVNERMPMCVGICVLLAIVFVLSRTGDAGPAVGVGGNNLVAPNNNSVRIPQPANNVAMVPPDTQTVATTTVMQPPPPPASIQMVNPGSNGVGASTGATQASSGVPPVIQMTSGGTATTKAASVTPLPPVIQMTNTESAVVTATSPAGSVPAAATECNCDNNSNPSIDDPNALMAKLRQKALDNTPPHIIECDAAEDGESQAACHLPKETRYAALNQKGATIWMTGCSGSGKTTIATALEEKLITKYGKHVYRLDGDNLRTGLNRDLTFTEADRAESVRRTGELATLFSDAGIITLVGLISPYRNDRDLVRQRHESQGIPFYEVFLDVPIAELFERDPKGQYARVKSGELKHFTCIDDPYEPPASPEIVLKTHELEIHESVNILFRALERDGILRGAPQITSASGTSNSGNTAVASTPGTIQLTGVTSTASALSTAVSTPPKSTLPNPDGDVLIDLHVPPELKQQRIEEASTLPQVLLTDIDLNWLQTIGEGWVAPLKGFMREGTLLETLHFNSVLVDPFNLTGNVDRLEQTTNFANFPPHAPPTRVSMPIPITLSLTSYTKERIEESGASAVALVTRMGHTVAILRNPEIYENRKEEIVTRMFGVIDMDHPYIHNIYMGGDYLIGGEVELLDRIKYNDGLDEWRMTAKELLAEFESRGADTVYAFQTRNPTHAGHAYLMRQAGENLKKQGYQKPILWLSPLGGWTKSDDVPLDVRVQQHVEVLQSGTSHPGGLDPATTVMAIWPAPMVYAGPTEVQFHAKSRRCAGASYFVVGRDPAGMKGSPNAVAHPDDDLYNGDHGRYVLQYSPGLGDMKLLSFVKVMYDVTDNVMKVPDESRLADFISISGSKMRLLAKNGAHLCSPDNIPTDLVEANCVPSGFMVPKGWEKVVDYYKNQGNTTRWIPWSQPFVPAPAQLDSTSQSGGRFGSSTFELHSTSYASWWHDPPLKPSGLGNDMVVNMVTEIPMHVAAKMEVQKTLHGNPIGQDSNSDGSPRYYSYGVPFFNYGFVPQTWEDPNALSASSGLGGDNDPLDIMEIGSTQLAMGSIVPCRVIGSLELLDEGETDHKILCISLSDPLSNKIYTMDDLEVHKPGTLHKLRDWLKRYKTSDGKAENTLASEVPRSSQQAMQVVNECHDRWKSLCGLDGTHRSALDTSTEAFWLNSPSCRGNGR